MDLKRRSVLMAGGGAVAGAFLGLQRLWAAALPGSTAAMATGFGDLRTETGTVDRSGEFVLARGDDARQPLDLRGEPRAFRPDGAEQEHRQRHRQRCRHGADRCDHAIGRPPAGAAVPDQHIDEGRGQQHRHHHGGDCHGADPHREHAARGGRRRQDQVQVGTRIERARDLLHGLRHHQRPGEQGATGDHHQRAAVCIGRKLGELAHDRQRDEMHCHREGDDHENDHARAFAPARGQHRPPVPPRQAEFVMRQEGEGRARHVVTRPVPVRRPASGTCLRGSSRPCRPWRAIHRACLRRSACRRR